MVNAGWIFFDISAGGQTREFGNEEFTFSKGCGTHVIRNFQQHGGDPPYPGGPHIFYVPIDPGNTTVHTFARFQELDANEYIFFDDIEELCWSRMSVNYPYEQWPDIDETFTLSCPDQNSLKLDVKFNGAGSLIVHVRGVRTPTGK